MSHDIFDHPSSSHREWRILRTNARSTDGPVKRNRRKGVQPIAPITWTREATDAFSAAYSLKRQYPGCRDYFTPCVWGLQAVWKAQGLPNVKAFGPDHTVPFGAARRRPMHTFVSREDSAQRVHDGIADGLNAVLAVLNTEADR